MGMKNRFQEAIQNVQQQRHLARRSVAMVLVLAMLTSMSVSWRLHQDGIALAADAVHYYCGKEEHEHTEDCYLQGTEPICGYYEGEIIEDTQDDTIAGMDDDAQFGVDAEDYGIADWNEAESALESEPVTLEEPEPEVVLHHHTADCYEEQEVLTCGIKSDHVHDELCYDQETGELLCTEHEHDDDCYTIEEVLVCGYEEGEPEETDEGIALDDMDENSAEESDFAEEPEAEAASEPEQETTQPAEDAKTDEGYTVHHHTEECYEPVLICGKEEHTHDETCLINPNAEIDAEYDAKTPARTDTDWADDMVLVAQSQLGYTESKADVDDDGNGYTMYADQYYKDKPLVYADWDSTFVAYCLYHAGVPQDVIPQYASISALRGELARMNSEYYTDDPQNFASILPGDIVMYKNADGHETIGVVSEITVDEEDGLTTALTVISGDVATGYESDGETTIDQVAEVNVDLNDVTSFVSVNAAYGYGTDDLMDGETKAADSLDVVGTPLELTTKNQSDLENLIIKVAHKNSSGNTDGNLVFEDGDEITVSGSFKVPVSKLKSLGTNTIQWKTGLKLPSAIEKEIQLNNQVVGKYTVSEDGVVNFVFNETAMAMDEITVEDFGFYAKVSLDENTEQKEIQYPGMSATITIKKQSDISIKKSSDQKGYVKYDKNNKPYMEFTLDVSTDKGTAGEELSITDVIGHTGIKGHYDKDSFELTKVDSDNSESSVSLTTEQLTIKDGEPSFTVNKLPALKAGEKYTLKYKYYIDLDTDQTLLGTVSNSAKVQVENGPSNDTSWSTEFKTSISKTGKYDSNTDRITWTIIVRNPNGDDLGKSGYTVTDQLDENTKAKITGNIYRYSSDKEDEIKGNQITITDAVNAGKTGFIYKFPEGSTEKYYKFVYKTDAPAGESTVKNNVDYKNNSGQQETVSGTGTVGTRNNAGIRKNPKDEKLQVVSNTLQKARWLATVVAQPNTTVLEITDTFQQPVGEDGKTATGAEHYALQNTLKDELQKGIMVYVTDGASDKYGYQNAQKAGIKIDFTFYDVNGAEILKEDNSTHIHSFKVVVNVQDAAVGDIWKVNVGEGNLVYSTLIDTTGIQDGTEWTITNEVASPSIGTNSAYYVYKKNRDVVFEKTAFNNGYTSLGHSGSISYNDKGKIWYQLWIVPEDGTDEINIQDILEPGLKFEASNQWSGENYCAALRPSGKKNHGKSEWPDDATEITKCLSVTVSGTSEDGQVININVTGLKAAMEAAEKAGKQFDGLSIMYRVQVDDPDFWNTLENTDKPYANHAKWVEKNMEDTATVTVERDNKYLTKSGSASNENKDSVTYTIDINPERQNLNERKDKIELTDHFTTAKHATAVLESATLVKVNKDGSTSEVPEGDYQLWTSSRTVDSQRTEYEIVLRVDDATHYKFTYTYKIDTSSVAATDYPFKLENTASIVGKWSETTTTEYKEVNGWVKLSADGVLKLHKVEKGREQIALPGAKFTLYQYDNGEWTKVKENLTPENGEITYTPGSSSSCTVSGFGAHKLMKLVETEAPEGYSLDATPHYFIWRTSDDPTDTSLADGKKQNIFEASIGKNEKEVTDGDKTISYKDVTYYGYGKSYDLTVRNAKKQIVLQKVWKDENGYVLSTAPDNITEIKVKIYKLDSSGNPVGEAVECTLSASDWTQTIQVEEGYTYRIEEQNVKTGYSVTYTRNFNDNDVMDNGSGYTDGDTATIINQKLPTSLKVRKLWKGTDGNYKTTDLPQSITVKLFTVASNGTKTEVDNGVITLPQDGKWEYTFTGLDPNAKYVVEEETVSGFAVAYTYPDGADGTTGIAPGGTVTITNTEEDVPAYELPSTGSPGGTIPYTAGGAAIALAAVLCGYNSKRKKREEE